MNIYDGEMVVILTELPWVRIEVDAKYLEYSPVINAQIQRWMKNDTIRMEEIDINLLSNYINFLKGDDFTMDQDDEVFFDYMGHPNDLHYPLDYWKLKLKNKWIRDNFYRLGLKDRDNGLYGLVEIPDPPRTILTIKDTPLEMMDDSLTIAGGAALYLSGYSPYFADIDIFPMNKQAALSFIRDLDVDEVTVATVSGINSVNYYDAEFRIAPQQDKSVQIIKREYSCPSEIVHSFDIDSTGFILTKVDGRYRLYATELALYSAKNRVIWFDPEFTEERYYWRLGKYIYKRFHLKVPFLDHHNVNPSLIVEKIQVRGIADRPGPIGDEDHYHQLMRLYKKTNPLEVPRDIGTLIILLSMFNLDIQEEHTIFSNTYAERVIGPPNIPGLKFIDYGPIREASTINDWVEKKKIILREPYLSKVSIDGALGLKEVLKASPLYIPDEEELLENQ